jgi:hypothetical protein
MLDNRLERMQKRLFRLLEQKLSGHVHAEIFRFGSDFSFQAHVVGRPF